MRSSRPIRCSTDARVPGQVEEHQPAAELEVPPLAAGLGGDQERRPLGERGTAPPRCPAARARAPRGRRRPAAPCALDRRLEHAPASRGGPRRRASSPPAPPSGRPARPASAPAGRARSASVGEGGGLRRPPGSSTGEQGRRRGEARGRPGPPCAAAPGRSPPAGPADGAPAGRAAPSRPPAIVDRRRHARRQAADVHPPGGAGAGRQRLAAGQPLVEDLLLGKLLRAQELEQAEEAVGVVLQRRRVSSRTCRPSAAMGATAR